MTDSEQLAEIKSLIHHLDQNMGALTHDVESLKHDVGALTHDVESLKHDVESLTQETTKTNDRVETYQKASTQVVNLAFSLILAATAAIVIPVVLGR